MEIISTQIIKVRITDGDRDDLLEAETELCRQTGAVHVQSIGYTLVLYRPHPTEPKIKLPRRKG